MNPVDLSSAVALAIYFPCGRVVRLQTGGEASRRRDFQLRLPAGATVRHAVWLVDLVDLGGTGGVEVEEAASCLVVSVREN